MMDAELEAIEARVKAATEGPWTEVTECGICGTLHLCGRTDPREHDGLEVKATTKDLAFVAAARSDVPTLVAEVRRLRRMLHGSAPTIAPFTVSLRSPAEIATVSAAIAAEREACAKVADAEAENAPDDNYEAAAENIAAAIRARKESP